MCASFFLSLTFYYFFFYYRRISRIPVLSLPRLGLVRHHRRARNFFTNLDKYIYSRGTRRRDARIETYLRFDGGKSLGGARGVGKLSIEVRGTRGASGVRSTKTSTTVETEGKHLRRTGFADVRILVRRLFAVFGIIVQCSRRENDVSIYIYTVYVLRSDLARARVNHRIIRRRHVRT